MTAEIAILNKSAVALAADSKVTLSRAGRQKTYDTVDKLFSLSKTAPVGAMVYGNAEFIGFPWETIIKEYRRKRPLVTFPTIFSWSDDLQKFLTEFFPFTEDDEDRTAISIAQAWVQHVVSQAMSQASSREEFEELISEGCEVYIDELQQADDFLTDAEWQSVESRIKDNLSKLCTAAPLQQSQKSQTRLMELARLGIRKAMSSPSSSGLVVAGFGEEELLPSLVSFDIDGIIKGRLKIIETNRHDTTRKSRGAIIPFAQTDMVYRFMEGIDPDYAVLIKEGLHALLVENAMATATQMGHDETRVIEMQHAFVAAADAAIESFWDTHRRIRRDRFASPILDMAMSLPKDELANLAESLVSLTSLQRRVSREIETVGGAIDVAVISKGDGFVWIKRKHYFSADRNLRFVNAYFSEHSAAVNQGGNNGDHA